MSSPAAAKANLTDRPVRPRAEPEVRRQLVQAASDKLWVVGAEIVGVDLKPGYVTLLDDELVAEVERESQARGAGSVPQPTDGPGEGTPYFRSSGDAWESADDLSLDLLVRAEEDWWLPVERPSGRLPWEAKDPSLLAGVRGSNMNGVVGPTGIEPVASSL